MQEAYQFVMKKSQDSALKQKKQYDKHVRTALLLPGNRALIKNMSPGGGPGKLKGELKRQSKLVSDERPSKILQNETKIIKIGQAVLEIINFKDRDLDNFTRKNNRKTENVVF